MARGTISLAIETSNPSADSSASGEVALGRCEDWSAPDAAVEILAIEKLHPAARHDDALMPAVDRICRAAAVNAGQIDRVAVSVGPGGYSAVRIAVATAKLIAECAGAECVPVESAAVAARAPGLAGRVVVLLASKRDTVWATPFIVQGEPGPRPLAPGSLVDAAALEALQQRSPFTAIVADEHLPATFQTLAREQGWQTHPLRLGAVALLHASRATAPCGPDALLPLYPREAEAVRKWRELGRAAPR